MKRLGWCVSSRHLTCRGWQWVAGFTLVEIMIAVAIFAIGLLGMSSMQIMSIRLNAAAELKSRLAVVGQEHMEDLLAQPYTSAVLADASPVGTPTTYCVLYPPDGLRPCRAPAVPPPPQGTRAYCAITQQTVGGNQCDDAVFAPPIAGYKVWWSVDKNSNDSMSYVDLRVSHKEPGQQIKSFASAFARSVFN